MNQQTLGNSCSFEGKGLHTGRFAHMTVNPAPAGTGIVFRRVDLGENAVVAALAENVSNTARSTTISAGEVSVVTIEHLMSALTGMGIDNAQIDIDNLEVPILDGSARLYVEAILACGVVEQDAERQYITIDREIEVLDDKGDGFIRITPADSCTISTKVDFGSRVLGVQQASWDESTDYAAQIGSCRTFVFFHEIEFLAKQGLVKGGDVDNAIVIVEHPVSDEQIAYMCEVFNQPKLTVSADGYLSNITLNFPDECGRHKLLDIIGDIRLCGGWLKASVTAYKPGHTLNTKAAKAVRAALNL